MMDNNWTQGQSETTVLIRWFQSGYQNGSWVKKQFVRDMKGWTLHLALNDFLVSLSG